MLANGFVSMKRFSLILCFLVFAIAICHPAARAQSTPAPAVPALSAAELAARLAAITQGNAIIRTQLEILNNAGGQKTSQLQIKRRRTASTTDLVYLVLWPNDQKGKAVILHQDAGKAPTGSLITPPNQVRALKPAEMGDGLFDSDLAYQDAVEDFFAWKKQAIVGSETINGVPCQILESKPDTAGQTIYGKVRSWIDPRRMVPLRVEKYAPSGELLRRIDTDRVAPDEKHHLIPAGLVVHGPRKNTVTKLNGAGIRQEVQLTDADFTPAAVSH